MLLRHVDCYNRMDVVVAKSTRLPMVPFHQEANGVQRAMHALPDGDSTEELQPNSLCIPVQFM